MRLIGPRPMPNADTPAHTPMAFARSAGLVNTLGMIESVDGMMKAPPTPMSPRVNISALALGKNGNGHANGAH